MKIQVLTLDDGDFQSVFQVEGRGAVAIRQTIEEQAGISIQPEQAGVIAEEKYLDLRGITVVLHELETDPE